jgi:gluconolactonase
MKQSLACVCVLIMGVACGSDKSSGGGSSGAAGTGGASAGSGGGAFVTAGAAGSGFAGGASAGAGAGGTAGAAGGAGAGGSSAGSAGTGGPVGFSCPTAPGTFSLPTAKATHIAGTTPIDSFNMNAGFTNVEGPVWIGDSLYFSEMTSATPIPPARILKLGPGNVVSVAVADAGSNGLAVDASGNLWAAVHKTGSISQVTLPTGPVTSVVGMYMSNRFISPNDLAIRNDGTIYFSDPNYQNQTMPAPQTTPRLYRVSPPPARTVTAVADAPSLPNGVTLSPDQSTLYVNGTGGFKKFAVMADGSLGPASDFASVFNGDGMAVDCAGNVYVAGGGPSVRVYSSAGASLGTISLDNGGNSTNVAFGGADHKTLYITAQGNDGQRGVFSVASSIAGFPY